MTLLHVDDVHVRAGATVILTGIALTIQGEGRHAITGPNGAGKTTLLHTIAGNIRPTAGRILLAGKDITGISPHRTARLGIARTWQHPCLISQLTVAVNIELALRGRGRNRQSVTHLLAQHDLSPYAHLPVVQLPYGLQRRAEFAAAIAAQPTLLLLDEPTAGLSRSDIDALRHYLDQLPPTTTVLFADHNHRFVDSVADTVHVMREGRLAAAPVDSQPTRPPAGPSATGQRHRGKPVLQLEWPAFAQGETGRLNLTVHEGEVVVVTGANGAGKTTLLDTIAGLRPPTAPVRIRLHGHTLTDEPASHRQRRGIGYASQTSTVFSQLSVADNLAFATNEWNTTPIAEATSWRLRQKAATLSGGEQRILALIRVLSWPHHLVLLDEPFEGLAPDNVALLNSALLQVADQGTAVLITDTDDDRPYLAAARRVTLSNDPPFTSTM